MRKLLGICPALAVAVFLLNPLDIFAVETTTATIPVVTSPFATTTVATPVTATPVATVPVATVPVAATPVVTPEQQAALDLVAAQQAAAAQAAAAQQQALLDALAAQQAALLAQQQAMIEATLAAQAQAAALAEQAAKDAAATQAALAAQDASMRAAASGMTYIDISLDNQILTYFVNGQVAITTPCVTGGPGNSTPRGVFLIDSKVPGKYLTGPTWHVWVNRWMRFCGNVGIHDASWRKKFGGTIYKSNGSHGCVNIPGNVADQLYNLAGVGTTVIVH